MAPRHVAIIMDGNGRWAAARHLPRALGHRMGVEAVRRTIKAAMELGLEYLTLYSFSSENWSRPAAEVSDLMGLMKRFIQRDCAELHQSGVRLIVIGDRNNIEPELLRLIEETEKLTESNQNFNLIVAFNYGGRQEIVAAAQTLAAAAVRGEIDPETIAADHFADALTTQGHPEPELLIRTSGEQRLSNFLLWQVAYSEFVFLDVNWPDFSKAHLEDAIAQYQMRDRRFGGLSKRSLA
ncbi:MAG: isoprenyl transferase [Hyphomicrobiaceae bacterium]